MASDAGLFNSVTRMFSRNVSEDSDQTIGKGKQRASPTTPTHYNSGLSRGSRTPERTGPSHISWLAPSTGTPSPNGSSSPLRFATLTSSSDEETPSARLAQLRSTPGVRKSGGSDSLQLQSFTLSDSSSAHSVQVTAGKPTLSPVEERPQFPALKRPSLDSVPQTPDSTRDGAAHIPHTAFLNRPLKRSISQTSTSTFRTVTDSVTAPTIPPVDLRPNFATSVGVAPPRRPTLSDPTLPTIAASPRPGGVTVSIIYEDSDRTVSFITAPSVNVSDFDDDLERGPDDYDLGTASDPFEDRHSPYMHDREDTDRSHMSLSSDLFDVIISPLDPTPPTSTPPHPLRLHGSSHSLNSNGAASSSHAGSILETISRRSATSDITAVETAIQKRWLQGLSFGSFMSGDRRALKSDNGVRAHVTSACILFFLGFIAPWCWLIGGWYLSRGGEMKPDGQYLQTVTLRWPRKGRSRTPAAVGKETKPRRTLSPFWKSHARAQETVPMSPLDGHRSVHSIHSMVEKAKGGSCGVDPWVRRCRVAAVTSGILLAAAVVVALVVVGGIRG